MVLLSNLPKTIISSRKKRLGRGFGSGVGAKSTRGTTRHQKSREDIKLWFEGGQNRITKKFPLLRGKGRNKSIQEKPVIINVGDLNKFTKGETVNFESLVKRKMLKSDTISGNVKILGNGKITVSLQVKLPVSKTARKKIETAGGSVL